MSFERFAAYVLAGVVMIGCIGVTIISLILDRRKDR